MNYSVYKFTLDLQVTQSQVSIPVTFGDTGRQLYITLTDGGSPYNLTEGSWAVLYAKKADGTTLTNNCIIDLKNMAIMYNFTENTANCQGVTQCEIILYGSNGDKVGSPRFIMIVDNRVISANDVTSTSEWDAVDDIFIKASEYEKAEAARATAETARAEAEKTRTTYIPSISDEGVLSWSNDKGLPNPAPVALADWLNTLPKAEEEVF